MQLAEGRADAANMHAQYDALFDQGFDACICPTTTTSKIAPDFDFVTDELVVDAQKVAPFSGWILTPAFNLNYTISMVNVPTRRDGNGVPTGMQIAARAYAVLTAFRVAARYAAAASPCF